MILIPKILIQSGIFGMTGMLHKDCQRWLSEGGTKTVSIAPIFTTNKQSRSGPTHKKRMKQRKKEIRKQTNRETKEARMAENLQILQKIGTPQGLSPNSISQNW